MDQEVVAVLKEIRGELVKLRNDFLMLRVAVEAIEKELKKPKQPPVEERPIEQYYGSNTRIEKL